MGTNAIVKIAALWSCSIGQFGVAQESKAPSTSAANRRATSQKPAARTSRIDEFLRATSRLPPSAQIQAWRQTALQIRVGMQAAMGELPTSAITRQQLDFAQIAKLLQIRISEDRDFPGYRRLKFTFVAGPNDRVPCFLLVPVAKKDGGRCPAILALHQTIPFGKSEVADETIDPSKSRPNMRYGAELAKRGFVVLAPDYPSFGEYPYDFSKNPFASGTMKGIVNHMHCVDILRSRSEVDPERIGAIGHSLGGHNAIFVAAFDDRIKAVVSCCGWCPFADYYDGNIKGWTSDRYMPRLKTAYNLDVSKVPFEFDEVLATLAPRAILSISPLFDNNFSVGGVQRGIRSAQRVYQILGKSDNLKAEYPNCRHDFPPEMREVAYRFLAEKLSK